MTKAKKELHQSAWWFVVMEMRKEERLQLFLNYFNSCHKNIRFNCKKETNNKLSFLDIQFITSVYRKPTFSGVFSHFDSFIPRGYKFNLVSTLIFLSLFYLLQYGTFP